MVDQRGRCLIMYDANHNILEIEELNTNMSIKCCNHSIDLLISKIFKVNENIDEEKFLIHIYTKVCIIKHVSRYTDN